VGSDTSAATSSRAKDLVTSSCGTTPNARSKRFAIQFRSAIAKC
jgi:hypothetical protein